MKRSKKTKQLEEKLNETKISKEAEKEIEQEKVKGLENTLKNSKHKLEKLRIDLDEALAARHSTEEQLRDERLRNESVVRELKQKILDNSKDEETSQVKDCMIDSLSTTIDELREDKLRNESVLRELKKRLQEKTEERSDEYNEALRQTEKFKYLVRELKVAQNSQSDNCSEIEYLRSLLCQKGQQGSNETTEGKDNVVMKSLRKQLVSIHQRNKKLEEMVSNYNECKTSSETKIRPNQNGSSKISKSEEDDFLVDTRQANEKMSEKRNNQVGSRVG